MWIPVILWSCERRFEDDSETYVIREGYNGGNGYNSVLYGEIIAYLQKKKKNTIFMEPY